MTCKKMDCIRRHGSGISNLHLDFFFLWQMINFPGAVFSCTPSFSPGGNCVSKDIVD